MAQVASTIQLSLQTLGFGAGIAVIKEVGESVIDTAVKMDRMNAMMVAASGNSQLAASDMNFVKQVSHDLGLNILAAAESYTRLGASTRGTRLEGEKTHDMFTALAAANAKLGGSNDDLKGTINALSQMISKGKVSMEELRQQLGDRLPGAMRMAAEAMGVTQAEFENMVKKGLPAEDFVIRFTKRIGEMPGNLETTQKALNLLSNEWIYFKQSIVDSKVIIPIIDEITSAMHFWVQLVSGADFQHALAGVDFEPRIEAFKKYNAAQKEYIEAEKHLAETEKNINNERVGFMGKLSPDAKRKDLEAEKTRVQELAIAYTNAGAELAKYQKEYTGLRKVEEQREKTASDRPKTALPDDKADAEAKKAIKAAERYADRVIELEDRIKQNILNTVADTTSSKIDEFKKQEEAELNAADNILKNEKLNAADKLRLTQLLEEQKDLIRQKYANKAEEYERKAQEKIDDFLADGELQLAKYENDKIRLVQLSTQAQIKAYEERYDKEIEDAKRAGKSTIELEQQKNRVIAAEEKKSKEELNRISGSYWDQLKQRVSDNYTDQGSMTDQFNKGMVDITMNTVDDMSSAWGEMVTKGTASWKELALNVVEQIEVMVAKMLIMFAVQKLVGMATGNAGMGSTFTDQYNSTTGLGQWGPNYMKADGGAFNQGVEFFANGGVVDKPTMFNSARGLGVMGEAGPEAIMPLTRGADGKLGVKSSGGSYGDVNVGTVQIVIQSRNDKPGQDGQDAAKSFMDQISMMKKIAKQEISNQMRTGNVLNPLHTR